MSERRLGLLQYSVGTTTRYKMVEDVWDCYGTRLEPLSSMKWWKIYETATALDRNHYQVWNGKRRMRLLWHSVGTTTKRGDGRLRLLQHLTQEFYGVVIAWQLIYWVMSLESIRIMSDPCTIKRLDGFKENIYVLRLLQVWQ